MTKKGDSNTNFFHKIASARRNRNMIPKLVTENERVMDLEEKI